ncbi:MAG: GntR family transcriptional regulator [Bryobacteraceae bacterium]
MKANSESSSLAAEAYSVIRDRIMRGEVAIGQVISRRKVAAELGMSFLPVSEAFLRLEFEGLLESRPRAGTRVRIPNQEDVFGQYVVREGLEMQAAKLFTENATLEERSELQKLAARVDSLSAQPETDRSVYVNLHEKLHHKIAEYARCPALSMAMEKTCALSSIWFCIDRFYQASSTGRRHQELLDALCTGDPEAAAQAMRSHILTSRDRMLQALEPYFRLNAEQGQTYSRGGRKRSVADPATEAVDA